MGNGDLVVGLAALIGERGCNQSGWFTLPTAVVSAFLTQCDPGIRSSPWPVGMDLRAFED